jgi:hypothetical protein
MGLTLRMIVCCVVLALMAGAQRYYNKAADPVVSKPKIFRE